MFRRGKKGDKNADDPVSDKIEVKDAASGVDANDITEKFVKEALALDSKEIEDEMIKAVNLITVDEWKEFREEVVFAEFNRELVTRVAYKKFGAKRLMMISTMVAIRGPKASQEVKVAFLDGKSLRSFGVIQKSRPLAHELTPSRILSCFPDFAAYGLLLLDVPKRIPTNGCPFWLQFPAAASITLGETQRAQHKQFCREFAIRLKNKATGKAGEFREDLYDLQSTNAVKNRLDAYMISICIRRGIGSNGMAKDWKAISKEEAEKLLGIGVNVRELVDQPMPVYTIIPEAVKK